MLKIGCIKHGNNIKKIENFIFSLFSYFIFDDKSLIVYILNRKKKFCGKIQFLKIDKVKFI